MRPSRSSLRVNRDGAARERAQASVTEVAEWADAPGEIARYLRESNCPATLRMGDDPRLTDMPWSETTLEILRGPSDGHDLNAVSAAFAGLPRVRQHQLVYAALKGRMGGELHALALETSAPA